VLLADGGKDAPLGRRLAPRTNIAFRGLRAQRAQSP
jgi:hypothetical protein